MKEDCRWSSSNEFQFQFNNTELSLDGGPSMRISKCYWMSKQRLVFPFSFAPLIDDFPPFFGKPIKEHGHVRPFQRSSWSPDVWNKIHLSFRRICGREEDCHESSLELEILFTCRKCNIFNIFNLLRWYLLFKAWW